MVDKERDRFEIRRLTAKGVLESGEVVDVEGYHGIRAACLEEPRHVFCRDRVTRLRAPILAGVAKIRNHSGDPLGTRVLQRADEEEQATELVVRALLGVSG